MAAHSALCQSNRDAVDSNTGKLLFTGPKDRSWNEFVRESQVHGWPSFRDSEVNWDYVRVLPNGECISVDGTHLGHNLPDGTGNRCTRVRIKRHQTLCRLLPPLSRSLARCLRGHAGAIIWTCPLCCRITSQGGLLDSHGWCGTDCINLVSVAGRPE